MNPASANAVTSLLPARSTQVRCVKFAGEKKVNKWTGMGAIPVIFGQKKAKSPFHITVSRSYASHDACRSVYDGYSGQRKQSIARWSSLRNGRGMLDVCALFDGNRFFLTVLER